MEDIIHDRDIFKFLENEEMAIAFAISKGLLPEKMFCCGQEYSPVFRNTTKTKGFYFRCGSRDCRKERSIRKNTFFENSRLSIGQIIGFMFYFVKKETTNASLKRKLEIKNQNTIVDWLNFCREICMSYFERHPVIIGGENIIVEVDEAVLCRRKYNMGRRINEQWVFGGYCPSTKEGFCLSVSDRRSETLIPLIQRHVHVGSVIYTDQARVYTQLPALGYQHFSVNHSIGEFVGRNGVTTNHVESRWQRVKAESKARFGTHRTMLESHLITFMWHEKFCNSFEVFLEHVKEVYPVDRIIQ